jgi:transcription elongation factor Elf1
MKIFWTCPNCEHETEVNVSPVIPAQTYGPPESCYPEEGGEIEPEKCEECGRKIPQDEAQERASEKAQDDEDRWADSYNDRRGDEASAI